MAELNLDVDPGIRARALHRVVRAMHDGHCPKCGHLGPSDTFVRPSIVAELDMAHICPECGYCILVSEANAALAEFLPYLSESTRIFDEWASTRARQCIEDYIIASEVKSETLYDDMVKVTAEKWPWRAVTESDLMRVLSGEQIECRCRNNDAEKWKVGPLVGFIMMHKPKDKCWYVIEDGGGSSSYKFCEVRNVSV